MQPQPRSLGRPQLPVLRVCMVSGEGVGALCWGLAGSSSCWSKASSATRGGGVPLLGTIARKSSRRQQDEASNHPVVGWQSPLPGRNPTLQTNDYAPPWTFSHRAPSDGVFNETSVTAHCYLRSIHSPQRHPKTPVLQHNYATNRHALTPGILLKEIQDVEMVSKPFMPIQQDIINQLQPETTAKVPSPISWAKSSCQAASQKQGSTLQQPACSHAAWFPPSARRALATALSRTPSEASPASPHPQAL